MLLHIPEVRTMKFMRCLGSQQTFESIFRSKSQACGDFQNYLRFELNRCKISRRRTSKTFQSVSTIRNSFNIVGDEQVRKWLKIAKFKGYTLLDVFRGSDNIHHGMHQQTIFKSLSRLYNGRMGAFRAILRFHWKDAKKVVERILRQSKGFRPSRRHPKTS